LINDIDDIIDKKNCKDKDINKGKLNKTHEEDGGYGPERIKITPETVDVMNGFGVMTPLKKPPPVWRTVPKLQQYQRRQGEPGPASSEPLKSKPSAPRSGESQPPAMPITAPKPTTGPGRKRSRTRTSKQKTRLTPPPYLPPPPLSPAHTDSTPVLTPSPYSVIAGDTPVLTGSDLLVPRKTRLHPHEEAAVADALADALYNNFFNVWPRWEDPRIGRKMSDVEDVSLLFQRRWTREEREQRDRLMREWKARPEREIEGRARYRASGDAGDDYGKQKGKGKEKERDNERYKDEEKGYESVMEARELKRLDMFRPTLRGMIVSAGMNPSARYRRESSSSGISDIAM
jgi:hypothetical protein